MNEELYQAIFTRKSVRSFVDESVAADKLQLIEAYCAEAKRLYPDIAISCVPSSGEVTGRFSQKAPHYLLLYSEKSAHPEYLVDAGFYLQQLDLYLHTLGLGSCWLGVAKPKQLERDGLPFAIMLAFGEPKETLSRKPDGFKRKPFAQVASGSDPRLEAAHLAPSATNSQNWFFAARDGSIDVFRTKLTGLRAKFYGRYSYIDAGIALCHLYLASLHEQLPFAYRVSPEAAPVKEGYEYLATI